jgi:RNA polymerase sigma factor (sigma-70 family)
MPFTKAIDFKSTAYADSATRASGSSLWTLGAGNLHTGAESACPEAQLPCYYGVFRERAQTGKPVEASALTHSSRMPGLRGPSPLLRLQSDERLIGLTRRGQPAAFETLCSRYQSRLLSFCRHMLGSREDAEDVLQEVFTAAFNAVLADEREINVRPWLYRIARNRSLNHLRRASAIGVDSMDVHFAEHGLSTGDRAIRRESFRELLSDVQQLPETQRTALLLREIDALSYDQIAHAMETTVPSVKSLLVRARISLAEAAEARKLSCEQVRLELGEMSEGLIKLSTPARRHVRACDRCTFFKKQLKQNNHALAAILPVGPLLIVKKLLLAKLGSTASAGGAHVASGAGATVGATATVGAGAVAATGGASVAGGLLTAGAGAIATKAVAGLAAAAIVTAGAVAAERAVVVHHHHPAPSAASAGAQGETHLLASEPVVVREQSQPVTAGDAQVHRVFASATHHPLHKPAKTALTTAPTTAVSTTNTPPPSAVPVAPVTQPVKPTTPQPPVTQVTQVTTETTPLPASATSGPQPTTPSTPAPPPNPSLPTAEPVPTSEAAAPAPGASPSASGSAAAPQQGAGGAEAPPSQPGG